MDYIVAVYYNNESCAYGTKGRVAPNCRRGDHAGGRTGIYILMVCETLFFRAGSLYLQPVYSAVFILAASVASVLKPKSATAFVAKQRPPPPPG